MYKEYSKFFINISNKVTTRFNRYSKNCDQKLKRSVGLIYKNNWKNGTYIGQIYLHQGFFQHKFLSKIWRLVHRLYQLTDSAWTTANFTMRDTFPLPYVLSTLDMLRNAICHRWASSLHTAKFQLMKALDSILPLQFQSVDYSNFLDKVSGICARQEWFTRRLG